jgi:3-oxoacyl-[acyl-carrier protein] reductase
VAGTVRDAALADGDLETMRRVLQVDLLGPLYVCRSAFGFLRESEGSAVVNVSSLAATIAYAGGGLYGASKGWARSDVPADGCRMGPFGIRVNVVAPGQIETPLATRPGDEAIRAERVKRIPIARRGNPLKSLVRSLSFCLRVPVM